MAALPWGSSRKGFFKSTHSLAIRTLFFLNAWPIFGRSGDGILSLIYGMIVPGCFKCSIVPWALCLSGLCSVFSPLICSPFSFVSWAGLTSCFIVPSKVNFFRTSVVFFVGVNYLQTGNFSREVWL